jgi:hypothetical protein
LVTDRNWLAVHERVLRGLRDYDVVAHPPKDEVELGCLAETITDNVASGIELSREAKRAARRPHQRPGRDKVAGAVAACAHRSAGGGSGVHRARLGD